MGERRLSAQLVVRGREFVGNIVIAKECSGGWARVEVFIGVAFSCVFF